MTCAPVQAERPAKAWRWPKRFAATCWYGCGIKRGAHRSLPSARCVVVPMAAAGGRDRRQHRRRFSALQQIVQLFLFRARPVTLKTFAAKDCDLRRSPSRAAGRRRWSRTRGAGVETRCAAQRRLGHSLAIREVDAGSCNGCELEIHALNNAFYDLERFGLRFVASPRHADVLLVTGPVTQQHARSAGTHLARHAGSEMGGRGGRLRRRRRRVRRKPRRASAPWRRWSRSIW